LVARRLLVSAAALLVVLGWGKARVEAADPQPYSVTIAETGKSALDNAMKAASQLEGLREKAPVAPFALISRARADVGRLETVLQSFGYYDGKVTVTIDDHAVDDANLPRVLAELPAETSAAIKIDARAGPLYHIGHIRIDSDVPPDARAKLGLAEGQPAVASDVLAAGARLLAALQEGGYALAIVSPPDATQDPQHHTIDVTFTAAAGRRATIGAIKLTGLSAVNESFVRRRLLVHSGQLYQPSKIDEARQDLASLGVF
jgi:translocation and assembly module TamA